MTAHLQHIANIRFGNNVKVSRRGALVCFQVSNISPEGHIDTDKVFFTQEDQLSKTDFLLPGDILLPCKGAKLKAAVVSEENAFITLASSSLFIIRLKEKGVLSEYLQWYLNMAHTQWILEKEATGTNIASLSIKFLRKLKIEIPDLRTQEKIVKLNELMINEEKISTALIEKRKQLIKSVTKNLIT